ncbi:MAG: flagellar basal body-associated FliL family protein [Ktedonobacterales bacterium]|nr:flagellar basal body-associated FliL family protein [Ktedonobacterales bacterium]
MIKKILLFGGLGLVLVVGSGAATLFLLAPKGTTVTTTKVVQTTHFQVGPTFTMPSRVVNLADPGANRYLKVTIVLSFSPELDAQGDVTKKVTARQTVLDDILTTILSGETTAQLQSADGKSTLKKRIIDRFSKVLDDLHLLDLYFPDFVMQ